MSSPSLVQSLREKQIENYNNEKAKIVFDVGCYKRFSQIPIGDEEKYTWFLYSRRLSEIYYRKKTKEELANDESFVKNMAPGTSSGITLIDLFPRHLFKYFDFVLKRNENVELTRAEFVWYPNNRTVIKVDMRGMPIVGKGYNIIDTERNSTPFEENDNSNKNKYLKYKQKYLDLKKILNN